VKRGASFVLFLIFALALSGCSLWEKFIPKAGGEFKKYDVDYARIIKAESLSELANAVKFEYEKVPRVEVSKDIAEKHIELDFVNLDLENIVSVLRVQRNFVPLVVRVSDDDELIDKKLTLNYSGNLEQFFQILANEYDLWIHEENGVVIIESYRPFVVRLPLPTGSNSGYFESDDVSLEVDFEDIKDRIEEAAENFGIKDLTYSPNTGVIHFRARPEGYESFVQFLEKETNFAGRFLLIKISLVSLLVEEGEGREFNINYFIDMVKDLQGTVSIGAATFEENEKKVATIQISDENDFNLLFNYLSRFGKVGVISSPNLLTANGIPASFALTREVGWWEPGEIIEDYGIAGDQTSRLRTERPTWESEEVGLKIIVRPTIVSEDTAILDIFFSDSNVYTYTETEWQQTEEISTVLKKPLIEERRLLSRAIVKKGQFIILAGISREEIERNRSSSLMGFNYLKNKKKGFIFIIISTA